MEDGKSFSEVFKAEIRIPFVPVQSVKKSGKVDHPGSGVDELQIQ